MTNVEDEKQMLKQQRERIKKEIDVENQSMWKKKNLTKELLQMSMRDKVSQDLQRKQMKNLSDTEFRNQIDANKAREKASTIYRKEIKNEKSKEIQECYEKYIEFKEDQATKEKSMDKRYLKNERDKLEHEQKVREDFFKKIKAGYKQDHRVLDKYKQLFEVNI